MKVLVLYEFSAQPNSGELSIKPNETLTGGCLCFVVVLIVTISNFEISQSPARTSATAGGRASTAAARRASFRRSTSQRPTMHRSLRSRHRPLLHLYPGMLIQHLSNSKPQPLIHHRTPPDCSLLLPHQMLQLFRLQPFSSRPPLTSKTTATGATMTGTMTTARRRSSPSAASSPPR